MLPEWLIWGTGMCVQGWDLAWMGSAWGGPGRSPAFLQEIRWLAAELSRRDSRLFLFLPTAGKVRNRSGAGGCAGPGWALANDR